MAGLFKSFIQGLFPPSLDPEYQVIQSLLHLTLKSSLNGAPNWFSAVQISSPITFMRGFPCTFQDKGPSPGLLQHQIILPFSFKLPPVFNFLRAPIIVPSVGSMTAVRAGHGNILCMSAIRYHHILVVPWYALTTRCVPSRTLSDTWFRGEC